MEKNIYLVCTASREEYKKAAVKRYVKNNQMDLWTQSTNAYACTEKEEAIKDCRIYNTICKNQTYFIKKVTLF